MKISRVIIENYRNLKNVDVTLGNTVTLIGENNCGKSNFLRALSIPLLSDDSGNSKHLSWHDINREAKYSLQGTTQGRYLTGGVPPVRFSM